MTSHFASFATTNSLASSQQAYSLSSDFDDTTDNDTMDSFDDESGPSHATHFAYQGVGDDSDQVFAASPVDTAQPAHPHSHSHSHHHHQPPPAQHAQFFTNQPASQYDYLLSATAALNPAISRSQHASGFTVGQGFHPTMNTPPYEYDTVGTSVSPTSPPMKFGPHS